MKRKFTILIAALMLLTMVTQPMRLWGQTRGTSQKTETFENATTTTTYNSTQTVNPTGNSNYSSCGIGWSIYYGSPSTTSAITGSKSCLIRYYTADAVLGYAKTTTAIKGLTNVTFNAKVTNTGNKMGVWYSTDGSNWTSLANDVTLTTSSASKSYNIPNSSPTTTYYVKIGLTTGSSTNKKDLIIDDVCFTYTTYTVSYAANGGSGTMTDSNSPYCVGDEVTLLSNSFSAPSASHSFNGWAVTDASSNPVAVSNNKFTMPASNVTVTAQWLSAGDYITVSPTTATPSCTAQNVAFSVDTDQTLDENPVVFYTTSTGDETTSKPSWIGDLTSAYSSSTLTIPVAANTGVARTAYFRVEKGSVKSDVVTINQAVYSPSAPTLPAAGNFDYTKEITITVPDGTTVYYTLDGTNPTSSSTAYSAPFTINATKTVKAVAYDGSYPSAVVSATYTRTYKYINEITAAGTYTVKGTVVAVYGTTGFVLGDGTGYIYDYKSSHGLSVGDKVSITSGTIKDYNHVWEFNSASTSAVATSSYTTGTPAITTLTSSIISSYSSATNLSTYFEVVGTYNNSSKVITVSGSSIPVKLSTTNNYSSLDGKTVKAKGYFLGFNKNTSPDYFYLCPESVEAVPVLTTSVTSISNFTYNVGGGPDAKNFTVSGANLTDDITISTNSENFEISADGSSWQTSNITLNEDEGTVGVTTIYVRLKSGLSSNTYNGKITVSSDGADDKEIALTGTVKHTIAISGSITNGSVESDPSAAAVSGATVTLTATPDANYKLDSFTVTKAGSGTVDVTPTGANTGTFEMPSDNVTVSATFIQAYAVTYVANGGSGTMTDSNSPYTAGTQVTLLANTFTYTGHTWSSWVVKDALQNTVAVSEGKFEMPSSAVTVTAQWTTNTHNITMPSADTYGEYTTASTSAVPYGTEVELTYTPAEGYENYVAVWSVNSTPIVGNTFNMPDEDVTVTVATHATWTVTYNANGGSGSMSDPNSPYDNGANVTVLANGFTYLNHTFVKWNTRADGEGTDYAPGATISGISANVTLYAQWEYGSHVTYSIETKTSVSATGAEPLGSSATFSQPSGTLMQLVSGNSMTLTLKGFQGQIVKKLTLSMKSNASAGAGSMSMKIGKTTYISITDSKFNTANWYGGWSSSYVDFEKNASPNNHVIESGEDIVIIITSSENSLYCQSFTIDYETSSDPMVFAVPTEQTVNHTAQSITTGDNVFNIVSYNIATPTFALSYCDEDGTVLGSNPYSSWFTAAVTDNEKVTYSVTANTGGDRTAYFKVYATVAGDPVYSGLCSVTQKHQPYTYTLVDGTNVLLQAGKHYIISNSKTVGSGVVMDAYGSNIRSTKSVSISSKIVDAKTVIYIDEPEGGVYEFVLSGDGTNKWTIYDDKQSTDKYLNASGGTSNNYLTLTDVITNTSKWNISVGDGGLVSIVANFTGSEARNILSYNYNAGNDRFSCYKAIQTAGLYLYVRDGDKDLEFYSPTTITSATIASDETYTVESGQTLNIATLTNSGSATNLIIEDGGQLITNSAVAATIRKNVASATPKDDPVYGWYTISSPLATTKIAGDGANTNLTTGTYDLLRYDEGSHIWENYKAGHGDFANMTAGRGYIYRNSGDVTVEYKGTVNNGKVDYAVTKDGDMLTGFNLIGNPYPHKIYKGEGTAIPNSKADDYELATGFYTLTKEGAWHSGTDNSTAILPGQGLLVQATTAGTISMTNTPSDGSAKTNNDNIKFTVANSRYEDVTYAWFDKGIGLDKIDHRNPDVPMLYISQDDENYAVATMSDDTKAFNLCFKAKKMGQYTLSYAAKGEFNYLHVIDCLTGDDVDMLLEEKYVFTATPQDKASRFIVRLAYKAGNVTSYDDSFAYQNGSDIIVNGEGELQIFDVMGRMVAKRHINGVETMCTSSMQTGVYILRLAGNDIKTQKIIIK